MRARPAICAVQRQPHGLNLAAPRNSASTTPSGPCHASCGLVSKWPLVLPLTPLRANATARTARRSSASATHGTATATATTTTSVIGMDTGYRIRPRLVADVWERGRGDRRTDERGGRERQSLRGFGDGVGSAAPVQLLTWFTEDRLLHYSHEDVVTSSMPARLGFKPNTTWSTATVYFSLMPSRSQCAPS